MARLNRFISMIQLVTFIVLYNRHREQGLKKTAEWLVPEITKEIGLEHARFVVLVYFFSSFEHAKNLLIMGSNSTKKCSFKCEFLIFNYE